MSDYLVQVAYKPESVANMIANPQNREEAIRPVVDKLGGNIKGFWFAFGRYDVVIILTLPDNVSTVALSMAVTATGAIKEFKTTPLLSIDESIEAMKKASTISYKPPSK